MRHDDAATIARVAVRWAEPEDDSMRDNPGAQVRLGSLEAAARGRAIPASYLARMADFTPGFRVTHDDGQITGMYLGTDEETTQRLARVEWAEALVARRPV